MVVDLVTPKGLDQPSRAIARYGCLVIAQLGKPHSKAHMKSRLTTRTGQSVTLMGAIALMAAASQPATAQRLCENYLVLPTGRQVCLDNSPVVRDRLDPEFPPAEAAESSPSMPAATLSALDAKPNEGYVAYLSQLESCTPSTTELPLPNSPDTWIRMTIQGSDPSGCAVDMTLVDLETDAEAPYLSCVYSPETLAVITDPVGYAEATGLDAGTVIASDPAASRAQALSEAVASECSI